MRDVISEGSGRGSEEEGVESSGTYGALHLDDKIIPCAHDLVISWQSDESTLGKDGGGGEGEGE